MSAGGRPTLEVLPDADAVARVAADHLRRRAAAGIATCGRFAVALSGGSTPRRLYRLLAAEGAALPWQHIHVFWSDERAVPPDHPDSNYHTAGKELLSRVPIPGGNVHRLRGEDPDPARAATEYEDELRRFFALTGGELPRFDLVLLGMGADGHTASLFPGSPALRLRRRLVVATRASVPPRERLTLTVPVLNNAACVVFLVTGEEKAAALSRVLTGPRHPRVLPAQAIAPVRGELIWLADEAAARIEPRASRKRSR